MNKIIVLLISVLLSGNTFTMQHQQHQHQQDPSLRQETSAGRQQQIQQKDKDKKKQRWYSNDKNDSPESPSHEEDGVVADLQSEMAAIVRNVIKQDASIDNHIKNTQKKKRMELCPICHEPTCSLSKEVY